MNKTKRALLSSLMTICLCISMLAGTTFAWFTDTASTGVNRIVAGNLDVDLLMYKEAEAGTAGSYVSIAGGVGDVFSDAAGGNGINWEPGKTEYVYLAVQNKGSLALKYNILLNITDHGLAGALEYAIINLADENDRLTYTNWAELKAAAGQNCGNMPTGLVKAAENGCLDEVINGVQNETDYFALAVHMKEEAGNEYMSKPDAEKSIVIDISVVATQKDAESDSFGNSYDANATFPFAMSAPVAGGATVVGSSDVAKLTAPEGSIGTGVEKVELVINEAPAHANITVDLSQASKSYEIKLVDEGKNVVAAANGTLFTLEMNVGAGRSNVMVYHNGILMTKDDPTLTENADHYVYNADTGMVTMKVSSFSPFTVVYDRGMWADHVAESLVIDEAAKTITISSAQELALFAKNINEGTSYGGYTVNIAGNINLGDNVWTPINMKNGEANNITINGNGHTITGLTVVDYKNGSFGNTVYSGLFKQFGGTIRNLTMKDSTVVGQRSGVLIGASNKNVTLENVNIIDSVIMSEQKNAGLIGYVRSTGNVGTSTVNITGCTVENLTFKTYDEDETDAPWQCGAIWGYSDVETIATVKNNKVNNITIVNDPNAQYCEETNGENAQLGSGPFIGSITNFYDTNTERTEANYTKFVITLEGNQIGSYSGFVAGNYAAEFCGAFYKTYTSESKPYRFVTKVVVNGVERTVNPFATVHEVGSQEALADVATKIKAGEVISITGDFTMDTKVEFTTDDITIEGNGHTITGSMPVDVNSTMIRLTGGGGWCDNIRIRNLNFDGQGGRVFHFHGGTSSYLDNVKIDGNYVLAINFYGTHGAVLSNCNITSSCTEKYAESTIFSNQQSANQLILVNSAVDSIYINVSNNDASTLANAGVKLVVGSDSSVGLLNLPAGTTLKAYVTKDNGVISTIGTIE